MIKLFPTNALEQINILVSFNLNNVLFFLFFFYRKKIKVVNKLPLIFPPK